MTIRPFTHENLDSALKLFNAYAEDEYVYKKMTEETFTRTFLEGREGVKKVNLAVLLHGQTVGFASGTLVDGKKVGYVTFVLVNQQFRLRGIGAELLKALEEALKAEAEADGHPLEKIQMIFYNPAELTWIVPGTDGHDHPNAPGVDVASPAYGFFKHQGYHDRAIENSFYLPLASYEAPADYEERLKALAAKGIGIAFYDMDKNFGMEDLTDDLGSEVWRHDLVFSREEAKTHDPIIIGVDVTKKPDGGERSLAEAEALIQTVGLGNLGTLADPVSLPGRVIGFAGPIHVQPSGRGYFNGIGVHSAYRHAGLGTALFTALCKGHKAIGSRFMTLFTGLDNPAAKIYQGAGFKIVHTWSGMEKDVER